MLGDLAQHLRTPRDRVDRDVQKAKADQWVPVARGFAPRTPPRGKPLALKVTAVLLYVSGLSMNRTAKLLGVSTPTVQDWLERFAQAYAQKPEPEGRALVIEPDEM